jgi:6-pyruvoyltetrahydropterin/6-carboxytetrahydropterin synthase
MLVTKEIEIDMAHRVPNHKSKCRNLHGHRYKIEVGVDDKIVVEKDSSDEGMVIDFSDLKEIMMREIDEPYDHSLTVWCNDSFGTQFEVFKKADMKVNFVEFIPTVENLAKYWFEIMATKLQEKGIKISHVKVWETPTSTAIYQVNS